jgi:hypothetical protein
MYVESFLSLVASGDEFKANQLQIKHDLFATPPIGLSINNQPFKFDVVMNLCLTF